MAHVGEGEGVGEQLPLLSEGEARGQVVQRTHPPVRGTTAHVLAAQPEKVENIFNASKCTVL